MRTTAARRHRHSNTTPILGIDLGYSGALVILNANGEILTYTDMPLRSVEGKRYIDEVALINWITRHYNADSGNRTACVERVGARPGQGVSSMFRFGYGAGLVQGVLKTLQFDVYAFLPQAWKAAAAVTADKQTSLDLAETLWPERPEIWSRAGWDGRAEAALIGLYGLEVLANENGSSHA